MRHEKQIKDCKICDQLLEISSIIPKNKGHVSKWNQAVFQDMTSLLSRWRDMKQIISCVSCHTYSYGAFYVRSEDWNEIHASGKTWPNSDIASFSYTLHLNSTPLKESTTSLQNSFFKRDPVLSSFSSRLILFVIIWKHLVVLTHCTKTGEYLTIKRK